MAARGKILTSSCGKRRNARSIGPVVDSENGYMHGTRNLPSVGSQKFTDKNRTHPGGQATLHPHPRVTAVAKTRNRRAACPLPQLSGRGILEVVRDPSTSPAFAHFAQDDSKRRWGRTSAITFTTNF